MRSAMRIARIFTRSLSKEMIEVTLTDTPANLHALVQRRYKAAPMAAYLDAVGNSYAPAIKDVKALQRATETLREILQQFCRDQQRAEKPVSPDVTGFLRTAVTPDRGAR